MKRVKNRALSALLLVVIAVVGLCIYIIKYTINGDSWAIAFAEESGRLIDRNGVMLSDTVDGKRIFAENADVRRATLHAVGEGKGFIGTGALTAYAPQLIGYNTLTGLYSRTGEAHIVKLTIDSRLNVEAYKALEGRRGAVMVMNYKTGEVLCMVSSPTFDPSKAPGNIENDPNYEGVYINRALSAAYTPGSVFKILTSAVAIENISDLYERKFYCSGSVRIGVEGENGVVNCPNWHGTLSFADALAVSCNCAFAELSIELGSLKLALYARRYGLSERTTIGNIKTTKGNFDITKWNTGALAWSGIGQHTDTVCPASMLRLVGAIANNGVAAPMRLAQNTGTDPIFSHRIMRSDTAKRLDEILDYSSRNSKSFQGLELYAKSGTAEVGDKESPHAWFTGYIRNEGCPFAFVVVVENGGGGTAVAGPIANRVMQAAIKYSLIE